MANNFRLTLWIFMTSIVLFMVIHTIRNEGPSWKITALTIFFVIGVVYCILLFKSNKNTD